MKWKMILATPSCFAVFPAALLVSGQFVPMCIPGTLLSCLVLTQDNTVRFWVQSPTKLGCPGRIRPVNSPKCGCDSAKFGLSLVKIFGETSDDWEKRPQLSKPELSVELLILFGRILSRPGGRNRQRRLKPGSFEAREIQALLQSLESRSGGPQQCDYIFSSGGWDARPDHRSHSAV